ncbi:MAG: ornithine cyclodeaminase family protein [Bacteroidota bacterium]
MKIVTLAEIKAIIERADPTLLLQSMEDAFIAYSNGTATIPPVGHLGFKKPPGDMHIKYGHISNDPNFVIKVATGFYDNQSIGLPNNSGLMLVMDAKTGQPRVLLQDDGYLTDLRTAIAGAVVAQHTAPTQVKAIGIIGTGVQARLQLKCLKWVTDCRKVYVFGRNKDKVTAYAAEMSVDGFEITVCDTPGEVANACNLIVTTTASKIPLLEADDIHPSTHITAMGSDVPGKQELEAGILAKADVVLCDSQTQCVDHGETYFAVGNGLLHHEEIVEVGTWIEAGFHRSDDAISVADLTGIATQDIKIASFVLDALG